MTHYIDADLLKNTIQSAVKDTNDRLKDRLDSENLEILEMIKDLFIESIDLMPAADVRPVVHGHWISTANTWTHDLNEASRQIFRCSICGRYVNVKGSFCNCGAVMDGNPNNWISISEQMPPENQIVDTKIDDKNGIRNETQLVFYKNLWWFPDKSMYVYYSPTHWKPSTKMDGKDIE